MKTCLIVDDSRVVRKLARLIFEELGFACRDVGGGEEALAACRESMPDVILLDWSMPGLTGIEFVKTLRKGGGGATTKVIFCSTFNEKAQIEEALAAGADDYIMKPFDAGIIAAKLEQAGLL